MKKHILLIDESLTVQKVVALTLDRTRFSVTYAKSRAEAMQRMAQQMPHVILISDQVADLQPSTFPRELETWLGRRQPTPPVILIASNDGVDARPFAAVLKKPFAPQALLAKVTELAQGTPAGTPAVSAPRERGTQPDEYEDQRLQKVFNDTFSDEARLVRETLEGDTAEKPTPRGSSPEGRSTMESRETIAGKGQKPGAEGEAQGDQWLDAGNSVAYKAALERRVEDRIARENLEEIVERVLARLLPPIVEKLVEERLDRLLKEHEQFLELKQ